MSDNISDLSICIVSCDHYADAWEPFFQNFFQNWPDCPYPIYLQTNLLKLSFKNVSIVTVGDDVDWSSNLKKALNQVPSEKLLLLLEDFWIWQPVDTLAINEFPLLMDRLKASYLRLVPKPPPDEAIDGHPHIGKIRKGSNYRVSFQASIWRRDVLQQLLTAGESAWEAEMNASIRSCSLDGEFLSVSKMPKEKWPIRYLNAIIKRKWTPEAVAAARHRNITLDLQKRKVCNWYDQWRRKKHFRNSASFIASFSKKMLGDRIYEKLKSNPLIRKIIY